MGMENYTSESQEDLNYRYANALLPSTITFGFFTAIGIIGNIAVLVVFSFGREFKNNNFKIFVICLGIIDLLTSAFLIPAEIAKHRNYFSFENLFMCKTKCLFNVWAGCAAALALLIICIDRYRKVCQPFKKQITPSLALKLCILLAFVVPLVLSWPGALMCGIKEDNKTNIYNTTTVVYLCETEPKYKKSIWRYIYKYTFVLLMVGVSVSCLVMYVLIGCQIKRHWGSVPASFRKDSGKELNSDYSSDTFGKTKKPTTNTNSEGHNQVFVDPADSPVNIASQDTNRSIDPSPSPNPNKSLRQKPKLVKQSSSVDVDPSARKILIKQLSNVSLSSLNKIRKGSMDSVSQRRTISRSNSGFGMRKFPYKTLIWFILTMIFVVTYIMYLALAIKVPGLIKMDTTSFVVFQFFYRFYFVNNIINPIIYLLLDKRFRHSCKNIRDLVNPG